MVELLGGQSCMESLHTDVADLQGAINDVFSRVGPVHYPSWKYPDKLSCDLDIDDLLDMYRYSDEKSDEEKQVSHTVLYELVIDRLVLLIQGMSKYVEQQLLAGKSPVGVDPPSNTSVGLVVKKHWNRMVQMHAFVQQLQSETKSKARKVSDLQNTVKQLTDDIEETRSGRGSLASITSTFSGLIPPNNADLQSLGGTSPGSPGMEYVISKDCCHKSSQTVETAFLPCESCAFVQKNLKESGDFVITTCQSQDLPSSLKKFKPNVVDNDWLTANEVAQWTSEQNKDLARITKHLDQLVLNIDSLESNVKSKEEKFAKLQKKFYQAEKEAKLEKETQLGMARQFDTKVSSLKMEHVETITKMEKEKQSLENNKKEMENQLGQYKTELQKQKTILQELKEVKHELEQELSENCVSSASVQSLQSEVVSLRLQLDEVTTRLTDSSKLLHKELALNKSASKHSQSLQTKQGSLMQRLEEMDEENENLRSEVAELEEAKENIEESLEKAERDLTELKLKSRNDQVLIEKLEEEKAKLKASISETEAIIRDLETKLTEASDRQRMLVEYPDLNSSVSNDLSGTGDLVRDMENQIQANSVRMHVLEQQNDGLRNSISKMLQSRGSSHPSQPIPLWKQQSLGTLHEETESHSTVQYKHAWARPVGNSPNSSDTSSDTGCTDRKGENSDYNQHSMKFKLESSVTKNRISLSRNKNSVDNGTKQNAFAVGQISRPASGSLRTGPRPLSGKTTNKTMAPVNTSSIGAYRQMKSASSATMDEKERPRSGKNRRAGDGDNSHFLLCKTFTCSNCDKIYQKSRDLEIHLSYCTG